MESDEDVDPGDANDPGNFRDPPVNVRAATSRANDTWATVNGDARPSPLQRSATEPTGFVARNARKAATSPNNHPSPRSAEAIVTNGVNTVIAREDAAEAADLVGPMYAQKRRRLSPPDAVLADPDAANGLSTSPPAFTPAGVMFEREEVEEFLERGIARAARALKDFDADQVARRRTFEAATSRANRRLHDAQERIRWLSYEHGEGKKDRERELAELVKKGAREKLLLRQEFEREQRAREDVQIKNIEALSRQNDSLRRRVDELERAGAGAGAMPVQPKPVELLQPEAKTEVDVEMKDESLPSTNEIAPAKQVAPLPSPAPAATADQSSRAWEPVCRSSEQAIQDALAETDSLSSALATLIAEIDDLSNKQVLKTLASIQTQNAAAKATMQGAVMGLSQLRTEISGAFTKMRVGVSGGENDAPKPSLSPRINGVERDATGVPPEPAAEPAIETKAKEVETEMSEAPAATAAVETNGDGEENKA